MKRTAAESGTSLDAQTGAVPLPSATADQGRLAESRKLAYIDLVRGIAILLVVWVHHSQSFHGLQLIRRGLASYGQMGVQFFFVASAFTMSLSASTRRYEPHTVSNFLIRRYFRIAPLYYVGILLYLVIRRFGADGGRQTDTPQNLLANVAFVHGFAPSALNDVVPGGWSIAVEMMFYVIFPALFRICLRIYALYGRLGLIALSVVALALDASIQVLVVALGGAAIAINNFWYFNIVNQLPVFVVGTSFYIGAVNSREPDRGLAGGGLLETVRLSLYSRPS